MKNPPVRTELSRAIGQTRRGKDGRMEGWTDRQTYMTKLIQ